MHYTEVPVVRHGNPFASRKMGGGRGKERECNGVFFLQLRDSNPHLAVKTSLDFCFGVYFCALVLGLCCVVVYFDVLLQFILALVSYSLF